MSLPRSLHHFLAITKPALWEQSRTPPLGGSLTNHPLMIGCHHPRMQPPPFRELEDLPAEKESPYFADIEGNSFDALSVSLTNHKGLEKVPPGASSKPCPRCKKSNDLEANFCCKCGLRIGEPSEIEELLPKLTEMALAQKDGHIEEEAVRHEVKRFPVFRFGPDGAFVCIRTTTGKRGKVVSDKVFKSSLAAHPEIRDKLLHKHRILDEDDDAAMSAYLKELPGPLPAVISLALEAKDETAMTISISKYLQELTALPEPSNAHAQDPSLVPLLLDNHPIEFCDQSAKQGSNWELALIASHYAGNWDKVLEAYTTSVLEHDVPLRTVMAIYSGQALAFDDSALIKHWHHILSVLVAYKQVERIYSLGKSLQALSIEASLTCFVACNRLDEPLCLCNASTMLNVAKAWSMVCLRLNQPSCFAPFLDVYQLCHAQQLLSLGLIDAARLVFGGISKSKVGNKKAYDALKIKACKVRTLCHG